MPYISLRPTADEEGVGHRALFEDGRTGPVARVHAELAERAQVLRGEISLLDEWHLRQLRADVRAQYHVDRLACALGER